jgi:hypothetical protein
MTPAASHFGRDQARARAEKRITDRLAGPAIWRAVSADGTTALSGSFDASAIRWSLRRDFAEQVLCLHERAVNAVAFLWDDRAVTAGADAVSASLLKQRDNSQEQRGKNSG